MNRTLSVAKKELRSWFLQPTALIFVATFLLVALFTFFWVEGFFARNVADLRPLFSWLPLLLVVLVPALGMRLWAEEDRNGTLELLRTLPVKSSELVAGKFLAGLALVAIALSLTTPLLATVALLGDIDMGPVWGGYLATLLVAGAWLSITMVVSATTSSQIVAFVVGAAACGSLYAIGSDRVAGLFGNDVGEWLRALGAGARFESILRGVLDLRDLLYFAGVILTCLAWNHSLVEDRRWGGAVRTLPSHEARRTSVLLIGANFVLLSALLAPIPALRWDLTERQEYSVSPVTRDLLRGLDEPLLVRAYFSEKTHPLLSPLVPPIRDMLQEYGSLGGERVRIEVVDPSQDPEIEKEARQSFGIESVPFRFADRQQASIVNSYFHVLIQYGDQYEVLDFEDLIEVNFQGEDIDVRLRNLEYDLTRAIQKVAYGFVSLETLFGRLPANAELTAIVTRGTLPPDLAAVPDLWQKVGKELGERAGGKLQVAEVDPDSQGARWSRAALAEQFGLRPFAVSPFSNESFYLDLVLSVGDHVERIAVPDDPSEANLKNEIVAALKRAGPGSLKTLGFAAPAADPMAQFGGPMGGGGGGALSFQMLKQVLEQTYRVVDVDLDAGRVAGEVDVLLVLGPKTLSERARFSIDQHLMRGGSVVVLGGKQHLGPNPMQGLSVDPAATGLEELLSGWGIEVKDGVVLDERHAPFPIPVSRDLGGFTVQEIQTVPYPAFVDVRQDGMDAANPALGGLPSVVLQYSSPLAWKDGGEAAPTAGPQRWTLLRSSEKSWVLDSFQAQPDYTAHPELGWALGTERKSQALALATMGPFVSGWKGKDAPAPAEEAGAPAGGRQTVVEKSPSQARLIVVGSSAFVSDPMIELSRALSDASLMNLQLVQNLADWCIEDVELLRIRSRGTAARMLLPTTDTERQVLEFGNYGLSVVLVGGLALITLGRRRKVRPMELSPRPAVQEVA